MAQDFSGVLVQPRSEAKLPRMGSWRFALIFTITSCFAACSRPSTSPMPEPRGEAKAARPAAAKKLAVPAPLPEVEKRDFVALKGLKVEFVSHLAKGLLERVSEEELTKRNIVLSSPDGWVALDHHAPRASEGRKLALVDLLSEDEELAPGAHQISFFLLEEGKVQVQTHSFVVGGGEVAERTRACLLWTPRLTFNGPEQIAELSLLALPLREGIVAVHYKAEGNLSAWQARTTSEIGVAVAIEKPGAGDLSLSAECVDGEGRRELSRRVVTLNPETRLAERE